MELLSPVLYVNALCPVVICRCQSRCFNPMQQPVSFFAVTDLSPLNELCAEFEMSAWLKILYTIVSSLETCQCFQSDVFLRDFNIINAVTCSFLK
jgi:hypothetical protein